MRGVLITFLSLFISLGFSQTDAITLSDAAIALTNDQVTYDPSYFSIPYPNGDVPANKGVCTDVIIRAYRKLGIDLQKEVHEDMKKNFNLYPNKWGLAKPDKNIDHRRVPNLMTYFSRFGTTKVISKNPNDYKPGDIVAWNLGGNLTHTGIVINKKIGRWRTLPDCSQHRQRTGNIRLFIHVQNHWPL